eukprot:TRINITY_DN9090_c0_g2_i1.p1 TRINITY_DN9090_c0_g2~~TRINITY_DN9090_c0_g2_i1.p1  ORF type:complete len:319 (-),score=28.22 TRINITY_DN9090_c0_g2_i1:98-1054(-)
MIQLATGFCGGALVRHQCGRAECQCQEDCQLPRVRRAVNEIVEFRISIRVLTACIPALAAPGIFSRQRPRARLSLGDVHMETNFAVFVGSAAGAQRATSSQNPHGMRRRSDDGCGLGGGGDCGSGFDSANRKSTSNLTAASWPWHFCDTVTFSACLADVRGPGLQLQVHGYSDFRLGPWLLEMAGVSNLGACSIDIREDILAHCKAYKSSADVGVGVESWESSACILPLWSSTEGGRSSREPVAHVTISFAVSMDPELIGRLADDEERSLAQRTAVNCGVIGADIGTHASERREEVMWPPRKPPRGAHREVGGSRCRS